MIATLAALAVLWDHRRLLRTLEIPLSEMAWTFAQLLRAVYHRSIDTRLRDELLGLPADTWQPLIRRD